MKTKNKLSVFILLAALMIPAIQSCKKYPDGPMISFRTRTDRVANTWKVDNYKKNGTDYTSTMTGYIETYTKDGNYSYSWHILGGTGKWVFQNNDAEIRITGVSGNKSSETLYILKLEEKQFWYYYFDGNDK